MSQLTPNQANSRASNSLAKNPNSVSVPDAPKVNWTVLVASSVLIISVALWAIISPAGAQAALASAVGLVSVELGWFYIATGAIVLAFMLWIALSANGKRRLGPDDATPQFRPYAWASMLFAAGIGVDLLFFSVAEPVAQYYEPPVGSGESVESARQAVALTLFHYGITGWAIYALMGLAFGYFAYRFNLPLSIRSALYPLIGKRIHGSVGDAVEVAAILGTIFGVATSLGIGVVQLNYGLTYLFGVPERLAVQLALVSLAVIVATISAVSGVDKGIKRLSEINVGLALILVFYVFVTGRTSFLLNALVMNVGDYLALLPQWWLNTYAFDNNQTWMDTWTLFFWAWWVAWAPFVGLFLARISKGRTIRQYVLGTLTIPFLFVLGWVSVFGNSALDVVRHGDDAFGKLALSHPERAFYLLLSQYPGATFVAGLASLIGLLLYVTSADSAALVMANFSSNIEDTTGDGPRWLRVYWAALTGILTLAMLLVGGISALQSATIVMGLPFAFVLYLLMISLVRTLRAEDARAVVAPTLEALATPPPSADPLSALNLSWSQWLSRATAYPTATQVNDFVLSTVSPALNQVAQVLREQGFEASVEVDEVMGFITGTTAISTVQLRVPLAPQQVFTYTVYPAQESVPSFALRLDPLRDVYFQVLAHSEMEGARSRWAGVNQERVERELTANGTWAPPTSDYDLWELTSEQVAADASGHFQNALESLA
ncbi:choline BCCT transporter BetT [Boudabousia tangfeifanii]|nr:choline BCCT transporter BetT [Boudabousia tangfeifanii]